MAKKSTSKSGKKATAFRVGRVRAYLRGRVWYLCYHENGKRKQPRVGPDREVARQMAAEINAQLEVGIPSSLGFEPISIVELRQRWLDQHEHVRRSSLQTIRRYHTATEHLINFITDECPVQRASDFRSMHAEQFVRYLRSVRVAPNGHNNTQKHHMVQRNFCHQTLKPDAIVGFLRTLSLIVIYNQHPLRRPVQSLGKPRHGILAFAGFAILDDLMGRGLPDIDDRQPIQVVGLNFSCRSQPQAESQLFSRSFLLWMQLTTAHFAPPFRREVRRVV